ncbi:discoidin domain-containing protein [Paenactinomyces guangxiensis]|uniref:Discoidin domain-containing protein n=1 Tax=Paenactinomyces guangxiensis TaxID=1490290 RepID=A0A7W1WN65_9BACL|nr:discoidin domain-containing protein [Paenactinomyces guangxiensis]MBA4493000.1 discoidin domain-containing protein [Paenactinomyces guangxiensis]MBH8590151.1 discoidin domain-containing protein [Paenactinomyces guangxiensis]
MLRKLLWVIPLLIAFLTPLLIKPGISNAVGISEANQTLFGPNVYIFDDSMSDNEIQNILTSKFKAMETNQFGSERFAFLFKPGSYNVDVKVGYYTTVAGLGQNPDDVNITGGFNTDAQWFNGNATQNFWRSVENFTVNESDGSSSRWAVSQAAPMRRMHFKGNLDLFDFDQWWNAGWASGGYIADSVIDGNVVPGSQQQFFSRNNSYGNWNNSVWNTVLLGDENPPPNVNTFPEPSYTVIDKTPVVREKPYLYINDSGQYNVFVPGLQTNTQGVTWKNGSTPGQSIPIDNFYIAKPGTSEAASINAALRAGKHLLFTPGIYRINEPIQVNNPNTVVFGLGYPTLIPENGVTAMKVADVDGVKVSGLLFDAGTVNSSSLMEVGPENSSADHSDNPISLHDVFFRVGGAGVGRADISLKINSDDVIGDHFWIWRADHGDGVGWGVNTAANGLVVNGDDVTIYGLFVEHYQKYQTVWNGDGGRTYFYQSEIPYDIPSQDAWMSQNGTVNGYASYKVDDTVTSHEAWGLGVYSYFRDAPVKLNSAIEAPDNQGVNIHHMTTIWLAGVAGSEITHVINNTGGRVYANSPASAMRQTVTEFRGSGTGGSETVLDRTGWTATSSVTSGDDPNNILDGDLNTRWTTGQPMKPGQSLTVDMKTVKTFDRIIMDSAGSSNDYARGYEVYVSNNGASWGNPVASGTGRGAKIQVDFPEQTARYIKVVQTGNASYWWSVVEFNTIKIN